MDKIGVEVRNPNLYPEPSRITHFELYKYLGLNEMKL